jgi:hypothetical protein
LRRIYRLIYFVANLALNAGETLVYAYDKPAFDQFVALTQGAAREVARLVPAIDAAAQKMIQRHYAYRVGFYTHILSLNFLLWAAFMLVATLTAIVECAVHPREIYAVFSASTRRQAQRDPSSLVQGPFSLFVANFAMEALTLLIMYSGPAFAGLFSIYAANIGIVVVSLVFVWAAILYVFLFPTCCASLVSGFDDSVGAG